MTRTLKSRKKEAARGGKKLAPSKGRPKKRLGKLPRPTRIIPEPEMFNVLKNGLPSPEYLRSKSVPLLTGVSWAVQEYINLRDPHDRAEFKRNAEEILIGHVLKMVKSKCIQTKVLAINAFVAMQEMDKVHERGLQYSYGKALDSFTSTHLAKLQADVIRHESGEREQSMAAIFGEILSLLQQGETLDSIASKQNLIGPSDG